MGISGQTLHAQIFAGRLTLEIKILEEGVWKSFTSRDCMIKADYKEGTFRFEVRAGNVYSKNGEFEQQEFFDYIEGSHADRITFYGNFTPEDNYMFENPTQNCKGEMSAPSGTIDTEIVLRTTRYRNDETRRQLVIEKTLTSPPLREGRQVMFLIDGIMTRLD